MRLSVLFENDAFIVIDKPSGLLSIPDRFGIEISVKEILRQQFGNIFTVHRLDKDTSGVIVFAKTEEAHQALSVLFEGRDVEKHYVGLVLGNPVNDEGSVDASIMEHPGKNGKMVTHVKGKPALTDYTVVERFKKYAWLSLQIHTGKTHQIRVHMQHIGSPIACDPLYGNNEPILLSSLKKKFKLSKSEDEERPILGRLALHAHTLTFTLGTDTFNFEAPIPKDLRALLQQLRKWDA